MAELNLKQIADKLNAEFTGDVRKLVFWYDDNAEFAEDIDTLELENAAPQCHMMRNVMYQPHQLNAYNVNDKEQ